MGWTITAGCGSAIARWSTSVRTVFWGSTAILWGYPARGEGLVIMTNSATGSYLRIEILLAVAAEYGWPIASGG